MTTNKKQLREEKVRKLSAGYEVEIYREPFGFVLRKGKATWSDPIRALSHLTEALKQQREEIVGWSEDYTDDFGTFDYEGYGMRVLKELVK